MEFLMDHLWQFWLVVSLFCLVLELFSGGFYILSFAIGAVPSIIIAACGGGFYWQLAVFAIFSLLSLTLVRPFAMKFMRNGKEERLSNADAIIGRTGVVSEEIEQNGYGRVALDGDDWKAESSDGSPIEKGARVKIISRESIIITVERV